MIVLCCSGLAAQNRNEWQLLNISEDDDFLSLRGEGTDRGYTSGFKIELFYTKNVPAKFPNNLLMKINDKADNLYGWALTQRMYTPSNILAKDIQYGERPYAGVTYVSTMLISSDPIVKQKLTTSISLGAIGKWSGAEALQTWVHGAIDYNKPEGWDNQISNDIVINYHINYERLIIQPSPNLEVIGNLQMYAGTLWNNMGVGLQFRAGLFNNYFSNSEKPTFSTAVDSDKTRRQFQCYFYMKTVGSAILDDATLQGGFFTHDSSPYVISNDDMNHFTVQSEYGLVLSNKRFGIAFAAKFRTPEFEGYYTQRTGNISLYLNL